MKLRAFRTHSLRLRVGWLTLVALLFQQIALAAYVCPVSEGLAAASMSMADCDDMVMVDPEAPGLCHKHCVGEHATSPDVKAPLVPALTTPQAWFGLIEVLSPPAKAKLYNDVPRCRSDPPLAHRFCSLQI